MLSQIPGGRGAFGMRLSALYLNKLKTAARGGGGGGGGGGRGEESVQTTL